jgi:hypothetical protein
MLAVALALYETIVMPDYVFPQDRVSGRTLILTMLKRDTRQTIPNSCISRPGLSYGESGRSETTCLANSKPLQANGLCLRRSRCYGLGGFSEQGRQASITVDMGTYSTRAISGQDSMGLAPFTRS